MATKKRLEQPTEGGTYYRVNGKLITAKAYKALAKKSPPKSPKSGA